MLQEKKFKCDTCDKEFAYKKSLTAHNRIKHSSRATTISPKKYACTQCEKSYDYKNLLDYHVQSSHANNSKKYACDHCGQVYTSKQNLKKHEAKCEERIRQLFDDTAVKDESEKQ